MTIASHIAVTATTSKTLSRTQKGGTAARPTFEMNIQHYKIVHFFSFCYAFDMTYHAVIAGLLMFATVLQAAPFHVAPAAGEKGDGSAEHPFATLEAARDAVRAARQAGSLSGTVTVDLASGTYWRTNTFELGAEDSGTAEAPVIYRAHTIGAASLNLGVPVPSVRWQPVTDPALVSRLSAAAKGRILRLSLDDLGVRNKGPHADVFSDGGGLCQLFCASRWMPLSRWPEAGYETVATVLAKGDLKGGPGSRGGTFAYRSDRPAKWCVAEGIWLDGFWVVPWTRNSLRVAAIDPAKKTVTFACGVSRGLGSKYAKPPQLGTGKEEWCAVNLLEEIDRPGEWCIRFNERALYFLPPGNVSPKDAMIADRTVPLVCIKNAAHIVFEGIVFEGGLGDGVEVNDGDAVALRGCTFRLLGGTGVLVRGGRNNEVRSSDFCDLGRGGIVLSGGNREKLIAANHLAENNHIWRVGRRKQTYAPPVEVAANSVGCRVAHNFMHDLPHAAVLYSGNDHVFEYNEVARAALDSGDVGAFYTCHDWTSRGTLLCYNFVYDSPRINAFYMDDGDSGDTVACNLIYNTQYGPFIGGGHDNIVTGNLVVACSAGALHLDSRGVARGYKDDAALVKKLNSVNIRSSPWGTRYPELQRLTPENRGFPTGNRMTDNAAVACGKVEHYSGSSAERAFSSVTNTVVFEALASAGFRDPEKLDFRPAPAAAITRRWPQIGAIPFEKIGLYTDAWRTRLPDRLELRRQAGANAAGVFDSMTDVQSSGITAP